MPNPPANGHRKLFIGLAINREAPVFLIQNLIQLVKNKPCEITIDICQGDGVARARNRLAANFLKTDCTHLLFVDGDIIFTPKQVADILARDLPIVGGCYPKKQEGPIEWVVNPLPDELVRPDGLQKVLYAGTGFLCIRRDVFHDMIEQFPEIAYGADYGERDVAWDFFSMGVYQYPNGQRRYLSEDYYFCQRWIDLGGEIFADTKIVLCHVGPAVYPLLTQRSELSVPATPVGAEARGAVAQACVGRSAPRADGQESEARSQESESPESAQSAIRNPQSAIESCLT